MHSQTQSFSPLKSIVFSGQVADTTGASITVATVSLEAKANEHSILWTTADRTGHFAIQAPRGEYILRVISEGFMTYQQSIHLADATSFEKDIVLQISMGGCGVCVQPVPRVELLDTSLTSTIPLNPLPPLKLHKRIAR